MNYLFIQLNNIDIPEERFDILSIGEGKNRRSIQQLNAFGKAEMTFFNSEEISNAFGYMGIVLYLIARFQHRYNMPSFRDPQFERIRKYLENDEL